MEERGWAYRRRQPEGTVLYEAVKDNLAKLLEEARWGAACSGTCTQRHGRDGEPLFEPGAPSSESDSSRREGAMARRLHACQAALPSGARQESGR